MLPVYILAIEDETQRNMYASLYSKYESFMYQTAFTLLRNADDAEDAVHQVFLKLIKNHIELDPTDARVKAYLGVAAEHAALDMLNIRSKAAVIPELSDHGFEEVLVERMDLYNAISKLPEEYQEALLLYYFSGLKIKEIAERTHISSAAAQKRLERAKQMIRDIINKGENN